MPSWMASDLFGDAMKFTLDDIAGLYAGDLPADRAWELRRELQDPHSEAIQLVEEMQRIARSEIDLHTIPGLEEIAALEDRLEERHDAAS